MLSRSGTQLTISAVVMLSLLATTTPLTGAFAQSGSLARFNGELQSRYAKLAGDESEQKDDADISLYRGKANDAGAGISVQPEAMAARAIEPGKVPALASARARLMARLNGGYAQSHPADMAEAQTQFDCWLEQQEEGYQLMHIWRCQNAFEAAMTRMEPAVVATPAMAQAPAAPAEPRTTDVHEAVYFDFDSSALSAGALVRLREVIAGMKARGNPSIRIVGHTDTTGTDAYNQALSERRARALADFLDTNGISVAAINASGAGEDDLAVLTGENVRNSNNRRATMVIAGQ